MSISYSDFTHRAEICVFGLKNIKITKTKALVSKRDIIRIDWIDRHDKACNVEFFVDEGTPVKGSIQATKELRKMIATTSD